MRKLTIGAVLILAMAAFSMNAVAKQYDGMTPSEETMIMCGFLKAYDTIYGLCEAYCEPPIMTWKTLLL